MNNYLLNEDNLQNTPKSNTYSGAKLPLIPEWVSISFKDCSENIGLHFMIVSSWELQYNTNHLFRAVHLKVVTLRNAEEISGQRLNQNWNEDNKLNKFYKDLGRKRENVLYAEAVTTSSNKANGSWKVVNASKPSENIILRLPSKLLIVIISSLSRFWILLCISLVNYIEGIVWCMNIPFGNHIVNSMEFIQTVVAL